MNILVAIVGINHWQDITHLFLDSILKFEPNARIIIVDNFSDEPYKHDRCWIERSEKRLGFPAAINLALTTFGRWEKAIVFNNDCWANGQFLDKVAACDENTFYGSAWNESAGKLRLVYSAWMVISRKIWDTVGQFDETFDAGWEDFDYELRCHHAGFGVEVLDIPVNHVGKSTRFEEKDYRERWEECRLKYSDKYKLKTREYGK